MAHSSLEALLLRARDFDANSRRASWFVILALGIVHLTVVTSFVERATARAAAAEELTRLEAVGVEVDAQTCEPGEESALGLPTAVLPPVDFEEILVALQEAMKLCCKRPPPGSSSKNVDQEPPERVTCRSCCPKT